MSVVEFVEDIDVKSFVKNSKRAVVTDPAYYEELKRKANFVDKMISPSANEIYKEFEELKAKADKWDDKEAPYVIQEYYSDGRTKQGFCKCDAVVRENETYCWSCGRRITFESGGE